MAIGRKNAGNVQRMNTIGGSYFPAPAKRGVISIVTAALISNPLSLSTQNYLAGCLNVFPLDCISINRLLGVCFQRIERGGTVGLSGHRQMLRWPWPKAGILPPRTISLLLLEYFRLNLHEQMGSNLAFRSSRGIITTAADLTGCSDAYAQKPG